MQDKDTRHISVCGLLEKQRFPSMRKNQSFCSGYGNTLQMNSSSSQEKEMSAKLFVPYPEEGLWLLSLSIQCYYIHNERLARDNQDESECL